MIQGLPFGMVVFAIDDPWILKQGDKFSLPQVWTSDLGVTLGWITCHEWHRDYFEHRIGCGLSCVTTHYIGVPKKRF
jgi:hypothetical protein